MQEAATEFDISATIVRMLADSRELELPFGAVIHLPQFPPVRAGSLRLQAYIFAMLASVSIGLIRHAHNPVGSATTAPSPAGPTSAARILQREGNE